MCVFVRNSVCLSIDVFVRNYVCEHSHLDRVVFPKAVQNTTTTVHYVNAVLLLRSKISPKNPTRDQCPAERNSGFSSFDASVSHISLGYEQNLLNRISPGLDTPELRNLILVSVKSNKYVVLVIPIEPIPRELRIVFHV